MKAKVENGESDHKDSDFFYLVAKYRRLIRSRTKSKEDAEDCEQEIYLKHAKRSAKNPSWFKEIDNKEAYIWMIVLNATNDINKEKPQNHDSIDDEDNPALINTLSDDGRSQTETNEKVDYEACRSQMRSLMNDCSEYEQELVRLNFSEGCKPKLIAKIMRKKYPHKKAAYIRLDCNAAMSKFNFRLKKFIEGFKP